MSANSFIQWLRITRWLRRNSTSLSELNYCKAGNDAAESVSYLLVTQLFSCCITQRVAHEAMMQLCLASLVMVLSSIVGFAKTVSGIYDIGFIDRCRLIQHSCQIVGSAKRLHKPHRHRLSCPVLCSKSLTLILSLHITGDKIMAKIVRFHEAGDVFSKQRHSRGTWCRWGAYQSRSPNPVGFENNFKPMLCCDVGMRA